MSILFATSKPVRELWSIIRLFLSKFGREAYSVAKEIALALAKDPAQLRAMTDAARRDFVVAEVTKALQGRYGHIPGFNWVVQTAVQFAVGWVRQQLRKP